MSQTWGQIHCKVFQYKYKYFENYQNTNTNTNTHVWKVFKIQIQIHYKVFEIQIQILDNMYVNVNLHICFMHFASYI